MNKRALISVSDKNGIVEFARELQNLGWELISTGGTYKVLKNSNIEVIEVDEVTNFNEILDGRVKTLHPFIHGGILYRRDDDNHIETVNKIGIKSIDMVVNNLYPFENVLNSKNKSHENLIENIDIGGPSMIRAAAKNYKDVLIVVDPSDYSNIIKKIKSNSIDENYRLELSAKAFNYTAYYDAMISSYFNDILNIEFPEKLTITYKKIENLRYGENPHQSASLYEKVYFKDNEKSDFEKLHGKDLSYNNLTDMYSAIKIVKEFSEPCVVGIKHCNPSGIAIGKTIDGAFDKAYNCDKISIFGGVFAINRKVTEYIAKQINDYFIEIVVAEDFENSALEILKSKKNIRLIKIENINNFKIPSKLTKEVLNGIVSQDYDDKLFIEELKVVTERKPTDNEMKDLIFAFKACKSVSSNGIVVARDNSTLGIGQGEVRRSWAAEEAIFRAKENFGNIENSVLASDAFFFEDTVELLSKNNIKAVIQPGGSIKDNSVIELCNKYGIAMVFTSVRHFRH